MEKYISRALESLKQQTHKNFEVIIVDNHSTDKTVEIIDSYKKYLNIKIYYVENHGNIALSRNLGIKKSKNSWLVFLDADDFFETKKIEKTLQTINRIDDNYIVIYHNFYVCNAFGEKKKKKCIKMSTNITKELLEKGNALTLSGTTVRKKALEKVNYFDEDEKLKGVEDYDLWIRLSNIGKFYYINEYLVNILFHNNSYSNNVTLQVSSLDYLIEKSLKNNKFDIDNKKTLESCNVSKAQMYLRNGYFKESKGILLELMKHGIISKKIIIMFIFDTIKIKI